MAIGGLMLVLLIGAVAVGAVVVVVALALSERGGAAGPVPSRTEKLMGQRGVVTEAIDPVRGTGRVNVGGDDWAATADKVLAVGAEVVVDGADGIVLRVSLRPA
jgi:membrane protein implicated in regulation of membrane protease activity